MDAKILVTGARGNVGSCIIEELRKRKADFAAGVTDPNKAGDSKAKGIDLIQIDFTQKDELTAAFESFSRIFILLPFTQQMKAMAINAIEASKETRAEHVVMMLGYGADPASKYIYARNFGNIEYELHTSDLAYTIIKPNSFMQNLIIYHGEMIKGNGAFYLNHGVGKSSYIDTRDIASAAAEILIDPENHIAKSYTLTGPQALTNADIANTISNVTGKEVKYHPIDNETARNAMKQMSTPDWNIDILLSLGDFIREGNAGDITDRVKEITGRKPLKFEHFAKEFADAWK